MSILGQSEPQIRGLSSVPIQAAQVSGAAGESSDAKVTRVRIPNCSSNSVFVIDVVSGHNEL